MIDCLSDDYSTLAKWAFPTGATLQPREFKVIFADGEPSESTASSGTRASASPAAPVPSRCRARAETAQQLLDYLNFDNVPADRSYGSCPDGQLTPASRRKPGGHQSDTDGSGCGCRQVTEILSCRVTAVKWVGHGPQLGLNYGE